MTGPHLLVLKLGVSTFFFMAGRWWSLQSIAKSHAAAASISELQESKLTDLLPAPLSDLPSESNIAVSRTR